MPRRHQVHGVPQFIGDVEIRTVAPTVAPSFDHSLDVKPKRVTPFKVPTPPLGPVKITKAAPKHQPTFDSSAEVTIHKGRK